MTLALMDKRLNGSGTLDAQAIERLYHRYGGMVMRRVLRFFSKDEAEDIVQEVFLKVVAKADTFRGDSSASTWLYQITTHYCLTQLKTRTRRQRLWEAGSNLPWNAPITQANQEAATFLNEIWRELDDEMLMIGVSYFVDDLSHEDIARIAGCSRRTVGNRIATLRLMVAERSEV